jgi:Glycosyl transferase family group 2
MTTSLTELRKTPRYRFFESVLAISTIGFFVLIFLLSFFAPEIAAALILIYSFGWLLRITLINIYTLFTYKNLQRWKEVDSYHLLQLIAQSPKEGAAKLRAFSQKYQQQFHHAKDVDALIAQIDANVGTKFENPLNIWQMPIFAVYNESAEVLAKSLRAVYESHYDLDKIVVFLSQEGRYGAERNNNLRLELAAIPWLAVHDAPELPISKVYDDDHTSLNYRNKKLDSIKLVEGKLNIICTAHPDGLTGEIIGKASNEDWGGRTLSLFTQSRGIDPELCVVTSLDADSSISREYFSLLSLRYALTNKDGGRFGFQSIPVYTKNIFETTLVPRMVAFQTTLWTMSQNSMEGKTHFFANYSVPLIILQEVNFWDREHIAEDYLFYARCFIKYQGNFRVLPFYGMFNGDAVIGDDYLHALENQYKQHQRWSWGGVESTAYLLEHVWYQPNTIPVSRKISEFFGTFINHHFWATAPLLFSVGILLPAFFGGVQFDQSPISQNLQLFSTYFAWISYSFVSLFAFISYNIMQRTADLTEASKLRQIGVIVIQALFTPFSTAYMAIPAINSQLRGLMGNYLGYWVTPKK